MNADQTIGLLKSVFEASPMGLIVYRAERNSKGAIREYRLMMQNKAGIKLNRKIDGEILRIYNDVMASGESSSIEVFHNSGPPHSWVYITAVRLNDTELLATIEDITEHKKAEDEIKKQNNILKQAEDLAKAGSWEYDVNSKGFLWSEGMYRLFEIKNGTPVRPAVYLDQVIGEDKPAAERIVNSIESNFQPLVETIRIKPNGVIKTLRVRSESYKNGQGEIEKMLGVDVDITEASQAEEKIMKLNKALLSTNRKLQSLNTELKTFNQIAASDYDLTLKNLYTNLEFIISKDAANLSDSSKANIRRAQTAIQRLKLLTEDIIRYSALNYPGSPKETISLDEIIQSVLHEMKDRLLECNAVAQYDSLPTLKGYPALLQLLFHNLIDNALKFCDEKQPPLIRIEYKGIAQGWDPGNGSLDAGVSYHLITVTDNGIGFDKEETERIFQIFYRLTHQHGKHKGSGIGLAICRKIMAIHEGIILAEPAGKGSIFNCFFPVNGN